MEKEKSNAGKYLSEILENDENTVCSWEILLNQWKIVDKKVLFKFVERLGKTNSIIL